LFGTNIVKFEGDRKSLRAVMTPRRQQFLREIALAELTEHEFLSESYDVQRTKFSTGHEVFINQTAYDFPLRDGESVQEKGFLIHFPDGTVYRGSIGRQVDM
jgi:hypothetical protein